MIVNDDGPTGNRYGYSRKPRLHNSARQLAFTAQNRQMAFELSDVFSALRKNPFSINPLRKHTIAINLNAFLLFLSSIHLAGLSNN